MTRYIALFSFILVSAISLGCGGTKELPPDSSQVQQVDPAEIQKNIQAGMKQGGLDKQQEYQGKVPGDSSSE